MALVDELRAELRVTTDALDGEISMWKDAALADMARVGVSRDLLWEDTLDPYVRAAVSLFVKAHFGYDNSEAERFMDSYRQMVRDILNSPTTYGGEPPCAGQTS